MEIIGRYSNDEAQQFPRIFAELVLALDARAGDVLGEVFHALELHNKQAGQFFTPYSVAKMMAGITLGDATQARALIRKKGYITAMEPACGAGATVIALADVLRETGINYQQHLHVTAIDIDRRAAHMAYVQFSLLHIPAIVHVGNTLTLEMQDQWVTPAHILDGWRFRLRTKRFTSTIASVASSEPHAAATACPVPPVPAERPAVGQLTLF